ncbi:olfactory receptor 1019-like, partial [Xenopus tropicalis]|uniref:Olfactory receptor 1019-like n=1 Tax=Xenopus tropicalis TaxID=8364 RepID=A0A8J1JWQ8_XENTR
ICDPLHYIARMSRKHCAGLITAAFTVGFGGPVGFFVPISKLSYCASRLINHFFCDVTPLLKLSCSSTFSVELLIYIEGTLLTVNSFFLTLTSYIFIISAILKIQSSEGRQKAFSTCASHLACVITLYGTVICLYVRPTTSYSLKRDKYFSLLYIVLGPVLNPLIYTLKNREFQSSLNKVKAEFPLQFSSKHLVVVFCNIEGDDSQTICSLDHTSVRVKPQMRSNSAFYKKAQMKNITLKEFEKAPENHEAKKDFPIEKGQLLLAST